MQKSTGASTDIRPTLYYLFIALLLGLIASSIVGAIFQSHTERFCGTIETITPGLFGQPYVTLNEYPNVTFSLTSQQTQQIRSGANEAVFVVKLPPWMTTKSVTRVVVWYIDLPTGNDCRGEG